LVVAVLLKSLRLLSDPTRVRLLLLLEREELSVAEMQEILAKGQSQISTHLAQLKHAGLVEDRRTGKNIFYRLKRERGPQAKATAQLMQLLHEAADEIDEMDDDQAALALVLAKRQDKMRAYFDELAGRFGREYIPGRSWKGLAEALLVLMPPTIVADLGAGEGGISQLLARRAKRVIAVDSSQKMVQVGAALARKHGVRNLEYRYGDMEALPIDDSEVDLAFFSQSLHHAPHPERAIAEASRILKPGGQIAILDLVRHQFEEAREMYADVWLGFTDLSLRKFLEKAGFRDIYSSVVHRETTAPHLETILAAARKPLQTLSNAPKRRRLS
jgi:ubiquinone/menaquinone biosynthesis C-methylase UbiE/predicted transcriptional regulator